MQFSTYWTMSLLQQHTGFWNFGFQGRFQQATGQKVSADTIHTFQETVERPFITLHKENLFSQYWKYLIHVTFPVMILHLFPIFGKKSIEVLLNHYRKDTFALNLNDEETVKTAVKFPEVYTEWVTFELY